MPDFLCRKTYGPAFTILKLKTHVICSFVILQVKNQAPHGKMCVCQQTEQADNSQISNSFLTAQLQATIKFTKTIVHHTHIHTLHSTCNAMNNMLRLTQAAITEHPTTTAWHLLNATTIHAQLSGHLMQVWPCTMVTDTQIMPMPLDMCLSCISI